MEVLSIETLDQALSELSKMIQRDECLNDKDNEIFVIE